MNQCMFFVDCIHSVFFLNIVAVIWVRTRKDANDLDSEFEYHVIRVMWISTIVPNIPSLFILLDHNEENQPEPFGWRANLQPKTQSPLQEKSLTGSKKQESN